MMTATLSGYLLRWEEAFGKGEELLPEELCADNPELMEPLRQLVVVARKMHLQQPGIEGTVDLFPPTSSPSDEASQNETGNNPSSPAGYQIIGELGRGGMGVVYKARQELLNRIVALKMILSGRHAGAEEQTRFQVEAEAIARVKHPGIVQVFDFGMHEGLPYFSLEFCEGGSLADRLRGTPLPSRHAADLVVKIARAVQAAHDAGIVHRDLKPANVLLDGDGVPRVTDFGLAKWVTGGSSMTQTGAVIGTPAYMAPEQAQGNKDVGPRTDVYALGAILYECLTGRPPFKAATAFETLNQVIAAEPASPRQLQPDVPRDLEIICLKCLQKPVEKRYGSAQELANDLTNWLENRPILARPVGLLERFSRWCRREPTVAGLVAAVLVALTTGILVAAYFAVQASQHATWAIQEAERANKASNEKTEAIKQGRVIITRLIGYWKKHPEVMGQPSRTWIPGFLKENLDLKLIHDDDGNSLLVFKDGEAGSGGFASYAPVLIGD